MAAAHPGWCRGSSPRVRGEGVKPLRPSGRKGIIPAGAGKSVKRDSHQAILRDHPRGCGEKSCPLPMLWLMMGSSPRVRGEVFIARANAAPIGIIPAGAGRRAIVNRGGFVGRDHPRGCGEKSIVGVVVGAVEGSSPRVRGEELCPSACQAPFGIIPAGAGRSPGEPRGPPGTRDHPRGCGEKSPTPSGTSARSGSSPRVRGEAGEVTLRQAREGIIPAGAGRSPRQP